MFIEQYVLGNNYNFIVVIVSFLVLLIGSITDFQKREVADWINYGLFFSAIALRVIYFSLTYDYNILIDGFIGFIICLIIGLGMFYSGQWGGGDTKMIIGLGTLFGLRVIPFSYDSFFGSMLISFLVNSLLLGSIYGMIWSFVLVIKNRKQFLSNWKKINSLYKSFKISSLILGIFVLLISLIFNGVLFFLLPVGILIIVFPFFYIYAKSIEKGCMVSLLPLSQVTEGDWIDKDIYVKGKYITGPRDLGITKEKISLLKRLGVKKVPVKVGIPFVPCFFIGFISTMVFGNIAVILVNILLA